MVVSDGGGRRAGCAVCLLLLERRLPGGPTVHGVGGGGTVFLVFLQNWNHAVSHIVSLCVLSVALS